ncbi:hypothetical protein EPA93_32150 [Ktedonosporobacter rubrisoli]|uniref:DoxX family membrane protein n=1 Tax=Ktedonosporobacter rubrisoli TaxID=2509675 RepID=A0A4P6JY10_KTERU|nr:DoxX family protein [Ktedonosporobacter rubrisoli]QBD80375.1 hypothetical protein EPA93_32150 [Ktedonosporobacter rubrisoli]
MAPFILLLVSFLFFKGLGLLGLPIFASWQDCARYATVLLYLFTASAHFTPTREDLIKMVPATFPYPRQLVFITGICEILGALGLLIAPLRLIAGLCLTALLIAMFPANINAARHNIPLRGKRPTPLGLRIFLQFVFIAATLWAAL